MSETNRCRALKCGQEIGIDKLFCDRHWKMIPAPLKDTVCDRVAEYLNRSNKVTSAQMMVSLRSAIKQIALRDGTMPRVKPSHPKVGRLE